MEFNVKKCAIVQFTSSKKKNPFHYTMKGEPLEIVHHHPYLGVELSDSLKYHLHIDNICKKSSSVLSFYVVFRGPYRSIDDTVICRESYGRCYVIRDIVDVD
jgi:hypothetical protein